MTKLAAEMLNRTKQTIGTQWDLFASKRDVKWSYAYPILHKTSDTTIM